MSIRRRHRSTRSRVIPNAFPVGHFNKTACCRADIEGARMSLHLVNLAWKQDLQHTPKIVLLALCDLAHQKTGECWPSIRMLAAKCGLSSSGLRAQLDLLETKGFLAAKQSDRGTIYIVDIRRLNLSGAIV